MDKINWKNTYVAKSKLKNFQYNPRDISEKNEKLLEESLEYYGQVMPLLVNKDYTVLGGNQRVGKIKGKVWIRIADRQLNEEESRLACISHNISMGDWDTGKIEELNYGDDELINEFGFDSEFVSSLGFDFDDLDFDDMDNSIVIKKIIIKFPPNEDAGKFASHMVTQMQMLNFEEVLLELVDRYNNDHENN